MVNNTQRIVATLATLVLVASVLLALLPVSSATHVTNSSLAPHWPDPSQAGALFATFSSTRNDALPGDIIGFIATIENWTEHTLTNLNVALAVEDDEDSLIHLENSTVVRLHEDGPVSLLRQLGSEPTTVTDALEPGQNVRIEWKMQVSECVLRDRWINVIFNVRTDQTEAPTLHKLHYIAPHTSVYVGRTTVDYRLDTTTPAPGDPVRHTVRVANTGFFWLTDVAVRLEQRDTTDRYLPTVAEDSSYVVFSPRDDPSAPLTTPGPADQHAIILGRSGLPGPLVRVDPVWSNPAGEFTLPRLNPGSVLILSWTDYVATDAPIGTEVESRVAVSAAGSTTPERFTAQFTVSPPRDDLAVDVYPADPRKLSASYLRGEIVTLHMAVTNHTESDQQDLTAVLDLPFALSYVPASGSYSVGRYLAGNARRLPDDWIHAGASLPTLEPGQSATIAFKAKIREDSVPQSGIEIQAALHQPSRQTRRATDQFRVVGTPSISMTIVDTGPVVAGNEVEHLIRVRNNGDVDLEEVKVGVEMTCGISYVPGSLRNPSGGVIIFGGTFTTSGDGSYGPSTDADNTVKLAGPLAAGEEKTLRLRNRISDDVVAGALPGPRFTATAKTADTAVLRAVMARKETEITVVEPLVTVAELEAARDDILNDIAVTADNIEETGYKIEDNTAAIQGQAEAIFEQVSEVNPWGLGWKWVLLWGGFGALASLIAGFAVWFVLPPTLWHALVRLRERRRRGKNPYLAAPATPSALGSLGQWALAAVWAIGALVATAPDRVRGWIDGLRRR